MLLSGCSSTVVAKPSAALTRDCDSPTHEVKVWDDVAILALKRGAALEECTGRMKALREGGK